MCVHSDSLSRQYVVCFQVQTIKAYRDGQGGLHDGSVVSVASYDGLGRRITLALQNSAYDTASTGTLSFATGIDTPTFGGLTGSTNFTLPANITGLSLNPQAAKTYSGVLNSTTPGMSVSEFRRLWLFAYGMLLTSVPVRRSWFWDCSTSTGDVSALMFSD